MGCARHTAMARRATASGRGQSLATRRPLLADPEHSQARPDASLAGLAATPKLAIGIDWREDEQIALSATTSSRARSASNFAIAPPMANRRYTSPTTRCIPRSTGGCWRGSCVTSGSKRLIEIGSGFSTFISARVNREFLRRHEDHVRGAVSAGVPDVDPEICLRVEQVQDTPLGVFEELTAGDVLFIDSSHVLKTGSDDAPGSTSNLLGSRPVSSFTCTTSSFPVTTPRHGSWRGGDGMSSTCFKRSWRSMPGTRFCGARTLCSCDIAMSSFAHSRAWRRLTMPLGPGLVLDETGLNRCPDCVGGGVRHGNRRQSPPVPRRQHARPLAAAAAVAKAPPSGAADHPPNYGP